MDDDVAGAELARCWADLTGEPSPPPVRLDGVPVVLPTPYRVADAAAVAVGLALAAAARRQAPDGAPAAVRLVRRAALEVFRSERRLRVDGAAIPAWDELTGDYRAADGWVRLHTTYAHHRRAALAALGLPAAADQDVVAAAVAGRDRLAVEDAVHRAGGAAGALRTLQEWPDHPQGAAVAERPLIALTPLDPGPDARTPDARTPDARTPDARTPDGPGRFRVLDLTRVIAGPTATKVLAALGAEVLRLDAPGFQEVAALVPDTTAGKRCARLDLRSANGLATFDDLVGTADVLVCGLRPGALTRLGRTPEHLARLNRGLVLAELSAYGDTGPWAGRRGFDSLVQLVTGIAAPPPGEPGTGAPVPLPVQALDHASGWLLAAGVLEALHRRDRDGRGRRVGVLLARTATWLDGLGRVEPGPDDPPADDLLEEIASPWGRVTRVRFPGSWGGGPQAWAGPPSPLGAQPPRWAGTA